MIINTYEAKSVREGAGVVVNRVFGHNEVKEFDPFLMLDYFNNPSTVDSPGFPYHPHKGMETISYILKGSIDHQDTLGNKGVIGPGELQWMTAGKGIKHQEMPVSSGNGIEGFQFWVNLPKAKKLIDPSYQYMTADTVKLYEAEEYKVKVIAGHYKDLTGPIDKDELGVRMLHIFVTGQNGPVITRASDKNGFIFVTKGSGHINEEKIKANHAYTLSEGDYILKGDLEVIFAEGIPLKEPIAWHGPIVMNTREEIIETFRDLENGRF